MSEKERSGHPQSEASIKFLPGGLEGSTNSCFTKAGPSPSKLSELFIISLHYESFGCQQKSMAGRDNCKTVTHGKVRKKNLNKTQKRNQERHIEENTKQFQNIQRIKINMKNSYQTKNLVT